jgi:hypothetical protein
VKGRKGLLPIELKSIEQRSPLVLVAKVPLDQARRHLGDRPDFCSVEQMRSLLPLRRPPVDLPIRIVESRKHILSKRTNCQLQELERH